MSFLRRIWAFIYAFFARATPQLPPERFEDPPPISDIEPEVSMVREKPEAMPIVGIRNPRMTGRTSRTHPSKSGLELTQACTAEELARKRAHHRAVHEGAPMLECFRCHELFPTEDIGNHPCTGQLFEERVAARAARSGSADPYTVDLVAQDEDRYE